MVCYCINIKVNDFLYDLEMYIYVGKGYVEEKLGEVCFKVGFKFFFQINIYQVKEFYDMVVEFVGFKGMENVYDFYIGIGSIVLYVVQVCKQVVGIEEILEVIVDVEVNVCFNDIENVVFYVGDVKDILIVDFVE